MDLEFRAPSIMAYQTTSASCGTVTVNEPSTGEPSPGEPSPGEPSPSEPPAEEPMMAGFSGTTLLLLAIAAAAAAYSLT